MAKETRVAGLVMDVRQGDVIGLGHNIRIQVLAKSGRVTRVRISAPLEIAIKKESEHGQEGHHAPQGPAFR